MAKKQGFHEAPDPLTGKAPEHVRNARMKSAKRISNTKIMPSYTPEERRKLLLRGLPSEPKVHYDAPKSGIINGEIYIGHLVKHTDLREGLVSSWTLKLLYPVHADNWAKVKNVGKIKLVSGKHYAGYSQKDLMAEDFVRSAEHWIEGTNFRIAVKIGNITQEEADSRIGFFEAL